MATKLQTDSALDAIARDFEQRPLSIADSVSLAAQVLAEAVDCERVSVWQFEVISEPPGLRCLWAKRTSQAIEEASLRLAAEQYRGYFSELSRTGFFASDDVEIDAHLTAMRAPYLKVYGIRATLDVPIAINGRAYWLVCCEQLHGGRMWRDQQILVARQISARVGLLISGMRSVSLADLPSIPISPVPGGSASDPDRRNPR